jgi:uncharacterized protein YjiS (DUF1127 family)
MNRIFPRPAIGTMRRHLQIVVDAELEESMPTTASAAASASRSESRLRIVVSRTGSWAWLLLAAGVEHWIAWRVARRDERILRNVPAHLLTDMGVDRADIRRAMRGERVRPTASPKYASSIPAATRESRRQNAAADQRVRGSRGFR